MIVDSTILIHRDELTQREWTNLFTKLTFHDAEQTEWRSYTPLSGGRVQLPRGAWALLPDHVEYEDHRCEPSGRALRFDKVLDYSDAERSFTGQQEALQAMLREEQGLIIAQPGFGKTQVVLALLAQIATPSLVLVHTEDIFNQWIEYAQETLPGAHVGMIQGSLWEKGDITIAMVQTIRREMTTFRREWADLYGAIVIDEGHHSAADTWEQIINCVPAKYRFAVTATKNRADGMQPLMQHLVGPVIYEHKFELKVPTTVVPLKSGLKFNYRGRYDWGPLQEAIVNDPTRNQMIAGTAVREILKGHSVLILSRRIEHLTKILEAMENEEGFAGFVSDHETDGVEILTGKVPKPKRKKMVEDFRSGKIKCLLSTQLADEALDVPILSRVILTYPGKHDGRLIQQLGRALREHETKFDAKIFDCVDDNIGPLRRQWGERKATYNKLGISIAKYDEFVSVKQAKQKSASKISRLKKDAAMRRQIRR